MAERQAGLVGEPMQGGSPSRGPKLQGKAPVGRKVRRGRREIGEVSRRRGRGRLKGWFSRPWHLFL